MNVPKKAIIVDNSSPDIVYTVPSMWSLPTNVVFYGRSMAHTNQPGASLSFSFDGVAIWYDRVSYT